MIALFRPILKYVFRKKLAVLVSKFKIVFYSVLQTIIGRETFICDKQCLNGKREVIFSKLIIILYNYVFSIKNKGVE